MATTIKLKNGSGAPAASDLVQGEPAIDLTNKRLYTENGSGAVIEVGSNPSSLSIGGTAVTATPAELNILDGVTSTTAELNILDGVTSTTAELNILDGVTSTAAELNILDGVTSTAAELNILDGVTSTAAELNILDGVTSTAAEINLVDGSAAGTVANSKAVIYGSSGEVNATTLQVGGVAITSTPAELNILDGVTSSAAELNILDGVTSTTAELNILDGVTSTASELNILDGVTSTAAELNILDGVTSTTAELNILDGVTSTTAELNILDGVTSTAVELNILDGVTSTTAELNILDGVTSTAAELNILDGKAFLDEDNMASDSATGIPSQQSVKAYVDSQSAGTLAGLTDTNITSPADGALAFYDTGTSKWIDNVVSGDITIADTGVAAIGSGVIVNADVKSDAAIDVSKTALVAGTGVTLSTNTLNVDASQTQITAVGTIGTGVWQGTVITNTYVADDLTINGGTIENSVIGASTAAAGTFTTITGSGDLAIDTDTLFVDVSEDRVGVNTASPAAALHVAGEAFVDSYFSLRTIDDQANRWLMYTNTDDTFRMNYNGSGSDEVTIDTAGNFGIGTSSPNQLLTLGSSTGGATIGLDLETSGTVRGSILYNAGSGEMAFTSGFSGYGGFMTFDCNGAERMRIDSAGNVGIGYNNPATNLAIASGGSTNIELRDDKGTGSYHRIATGGTNGQNLTLTFDNGGTGSAHFKIRGNGTSEFLRIDSTGNLLVGKTSQSGTTLGPELLANGQINAASAGDFLNMYSTSASAYRFYVTNAGQINATNGSIQSISDASLKENIRDLDKGLETINALQPRRFDWKNGDGNDIMGFVAQEVESVFPELVHECKYTDEETKLALKMGDMAPSMVKAIQELSTQVTELKAEVAALKEAN